MTHVLAGFKDKTINVVRDLSQEEVATIEASIGEINRLEMNAHLWLIAKMNYLECKKLLSEALEKYRAEGMNQLTLMRMRLEINRTIMNFLASVRAFLDQSGHALSDRFGPESEQFSKFRAAQATEYDGSFSYRFAYKLRDYAQHYGFPADSIKTSSAVLENGLREHKIAVEVNRDQFINSGFEWKAKVKADLAGMPETFDLIQVLDDVDGSLTRLQTLRIELESGPAVKGLQVLLPFIDEAKSHGYPMMLPASYREGGEKLNTNFTFFPMNSIAIMQASIKQGSQK